MTMGLLHKTFTGEKLWLFLPEFLCLWPVRVPEALFSYGKVSGKIMLTKVFRFYQSFFSSKSFMQ